MSDIIDNSEVNMIMEKLENLEDEVLAVELLKEFNRKTKRLGELVLNQDAQLSHDEWKNLCDQAQEEVDEIVNRIKSL